MALLSYGPAAESRDLIVSAGRGSQPGSDQANRTRSIDFGFFTHERSMRQHIEVGVAYTRLTTDSGTDTELYALSVYPQLTLYPAPGSRVSAASPGWAQPYFFVRALGPTYLSSNRLGNRRQSENLSFLAQIGAGVLFDAGATMKMNVRVSWKHFSNANLFDENDGFDVPFVISLGVRF